MQKITDATKKQHYFYFDVFLSKEQLPLHPHYKTHFKALKFFFENTSIFSEHHKNMLKTQ